MTTETTSIADLLERRDEPETLEQMVERYWTLMDAADTLYAEAKTLEAQIIYEAKGDKAVNLPITYAIDKRKLQAWMDDRNKRQQAAEMAPKIKVVE